MGFQKVNKEDILKLTEIVGKENILSGKDIQEDYAKDELGTVKVYPDVVVFCSTTKEVSKVMKYAYDKTIPVTVRGSGTGLVGGSVPIKKGILLVLTKFNKILNLDEKNLCLEVEPGVLIMDIYDYVEAHGLFYAPDPGEKTATIGGNVATNAGGMRAVKYGITRDWVRALEVVLADGTVETFGRVVAKNSTGYSLKDLIIGSEGTLGIITKIYLRLIALPEKAISLLVPFTSFDKAIEAVPKILRSRLTPTAVEFFEKDTIKFAENFLGKKFPDGKYPAYLLLTFDGQTKDEIKASFQKGANLLIDELEAADCLIVDTDERKDDVWSARGSFLEAIKASTTEMDECDVVVPRSEVAEFIKYTKEVSKDLKVRIPSFGHAGDGNLHIYICRDDLNKEEWERVLKEAFKRFYEKASLMGGLASGEHGIGFAKKDYMSSMLGKTQTRIMKEIKKVFDPKGILNPGKIV